MFNFKDELSRYQPVRELEQIEEALQPSQLKDLVDILEHISQEKVKENPKTTKE